MTSRFFGPHVHILLYIECHVNAPFIYDRPKVVFLRVVEDGLDLGQYDGVVNKTQPITTTNIQVLLLDGSSYLDPPRGCIINKR